MSPQAVRTVATASRAVSAEARRIAVGKKDREKWHVVMVSVFRKYTRRGQFLAETAPVIWNRPRNRIDNPVRAPTGFAWAAAPVIQR